MQYINIKIEDLTPELSKKVRAYSSFVVTALIQSGNPIAKIARHVDHSIIITAIGRLPRGADSDRLRGDLYLGYLDYIVDLINEAKCRDADIFKMYWSMRDLIGNRMFIFDGGEFPSECSENDRRLLLEIRYGNARRFAECVKLVAAENRSW